MSSLDQTIKRYIDLVLMSRILRSKVTEYED